MKKIALILVFILTMSCTSKEESLLGEWKKTEEHNGGNLGEKVIVEKTNLNRIYTFEKNNKLLLVADGIRYEGVYEIVQHKKDCILHTITSSKKESRTFDSYFRIHFTDSTTMKKISLIPIYADNELMYSSGRADIYEKVK